MGMEELKMKEKLKYACPVCGSALLFTYDRKTSMRLLISPNGNIREDHYDSNTDKKIVCSENAKHKLPKDLLEEAYLLAEENIP
jgi:hypothetical protein